MVIKEVIPNEKRLKIKGMVKHFNEEAKRINSPYYMYNDCIYLGKRGIFNGFDDIPIRYSESDDCFEFFQRISYSLFKEIKPILEAIPENFEVKLL